MSTHITDFFSQIYLNFAMSGLPWIGGGAHFEGKSSMRTDAILSHQASRIFDVSSAVLDQIACLPDEDSITAVAEMMAVAKVIIKTCSNKGFYAHHSDVRGFDFLIQFLDDEIDFVDVQCENITIVLVKDDVGKIIVLEIGFGSVH